MAEKTDERVTDEKVVEIEMERLREFANFHYFSDFPRIAQKHYVHIVHVY